MGTVINVTTIDMARLHNDNESNSTIRADSHKAPHHPKRERGCYALSTHITIRQCLLLHIFYFNMHIYYYYYYYRLRVVYQYQNITKNKQKYHISIFHLILLKSLLHYINVTLTVIIIILLLLFKPCISTNWYISNHILTSILSRLIPALP